MSYEKWAEQYQFENYNPVSYRGMRGFQKEQGYGYGTITGTSIESFFYVSSLIHQIEHCFTNVKNVKAEYSSNELDDVLKETVTLSFTQNEFFVSLTLYFNKIGNECSLRALRHSHHVKFKQKSDDSCEQQLNKLVEISMDFLTENSRNRLDLVTNEYEIDFILN